MKTAMKVMLGVMLVCLMTTSVWAGGKVLVVHSYHKGYAWTDTIQQGIEKTLKDSDVEMDVFYMDTKRKASAEWKVESGKLAMAKVDEFKPDVVITSDDNAQEYFAKNYAGKSTPQIIFCGVNAEAKKYGFPADNVTGILERPHYKDSIGMLQSINKKIKKIAVITDKSTTSDAVVEYLKKQKSPVQVVSYDQPVTFDEWKQCIEKYNNEVDAVGIYMYHTVLEKELPKDSKEEAVSMDPGKVIGWTMENLTKPSMGFLALNIDDGIMCGIAESGQEHGGESARIAMEIIGGKTAKDFPIKTAKKGEILLNVATAERLNVSIPFALIEAADRVVGAKKTTAVASDGSGAQSK